MSAPIELSMPSDSSLTLALLGNTQLLVQSANGETRGVLASGKPLALLSFLHCAPAQSASREQLLELLWSDADPESGRHTLRQTLWYVRRRLGFDPFATTGDGLRLVGGITSDREAFLAALDADDPDVAIQRYGGDFFPEFAAPGGAGFEHWADIERTRLRALFIGAATRVVRDRLGKGRARDAIIIARRVHDLAPRQQGAWRLLLESYLAADDLVGATVELERIERWLADEEMEPDAATVQMMKAVRAGKSNGRSPVKAKGNAHGNAHSNAHSLGSPLVTSGGNGSAVGMDEAADSGTLHAELVGRELEFSALLGAVESIKRTQFRHVHLSALAGHGKTRLIDGFAARLRSTRVRVVSVRATPAERSLPYAFAAQLVSALVSMRGASAVSPDSARTLVALAPASSSYLSAEPDRSSGDEALRRRCLAVTELVATIAHDAPLVVLVDDVHWMDAQSRTILASLATRVGAASVLLVTTARPTDRFVDDTPTAQQLVLAPLTLDDVGALVMSIGQLPTEKWSDQLVLGLHQASKGSPLLVLESLQLVMERDQLRLRDGTWSTPDAELLASTLHTGSAMQQRLAALPSAARDALLRLSVAGTAVSERTLSSLLSADGRDSLSLLDARGLIARHDDSWHVVHDEIAALAIHLASDADRVRANDAMAHTLERDAGEDVSLLLRAAAHRARTRDTAALDRVFSRTIRSAHLVGELPAIRSLGREVLGTDASSAEIDQLVARLPWRVRHRAQWWLSGTVFAASLLMLIAAVTFSRSAHSPELPALLTMDILVGDTTVMVSMPDISDDLSFNQPVDVTIVTPPVSPRVLDTVAISGRLWDGSYVGSMVHKSDAKRGMDIVRVVGTDVVQSLVANNHDQSTPLVSPDGRHFLFSNGEWHDDQRAEIGLFDMDSRRVTRLTNTDDREIGYVWSIEGSRFAYVRSPAKEGANSVCWSSADAQQGECKQLPVDVIPTGIAGWRSDDDVLVIAERVENPQPVLLSLNIRSGDWRLIDETGTNYQADPTGRVILCHCRVSGYPAPVLAVFSASTPSVKRALRFEGQAVSGAGSRFLTWRQSLVSLKQIHIEGRPDVLPNQRHRFSVVGVDNQNRRTSVPFASWRSLDTLVAVSEGDGVFHTRSAGTTRIIVSAGGLLSDTLEVHVRESAVHSVLRERWTRPVESGWIRFGDPQPEIFGQALRLNGDGHLKSGVVSRDSLDLRNGGGVHAMVRLPLTASWWQSVSVSLKFVASGPAMREWERETSREDPTGPASSARSCTFATPRNEGGAFMRLSTFLASGSAVKLPRSTPFIGDGNWHGVTLQVFADGHCALAIDGTPIAISSHAIVVDQPVRAVFDGQSHNSTVEVGAVDVWSGTRGDIDWSSIRSAASVAHASPLARNR